MLRKFVSSVQLFVPTKKSQHFLTEYFGRTTPITVLALVTIFFANTSVQAQVVAKVNDKNITLKEFNDKYEDIRNKVINPPTPKEFLEDLVRFEVGVQEAEKKGIQNDPLFKQKMKEEMYKLLIEKAIGKEVEKIKVSEKEMREYYKDNPEVRTSHILIEVAPGATKQQRETAKKRAEEIYAEVKKSKRPFEELVKLYTDDSLTKDFGGDIGFQSRVTLVPTYYDAAIGMKKDQIKGLIESRYGFHIIKLTDRRSYSSANKRQIRAAVFDQKRKKLFDQYFSQLKKQYKISKSTQNLKSTN